MITKATGAEPYFVGKPNPMMFRSAMNRIEAHSESTIMIGDRMDTDVVAGIEAGLETVLVLSGSTAAADVRPLPVPPQPDPRLDRRRHRPRLTARGRPLNGASAVQVGQPGLGRGQQVQLGGHQHQHRAGRSPAGRPGTPSCTPAPPAAAAGRRPGRAPSAATRHSPTRGRGEHRRPGADEHDLAERPRRRCRRCW